MTTRERSQTGEAELASPVCEMAALDPADLGFLNRTELLQLLNGLLEDIRAEARMMSEIETLDAHRGHGSLFRQLRTEQARAIVLLLRQIERLDGRSSLRTAELNPRPPAHAPVEVQLQFFNQCQLRLHRRLDEALPRIEDDTLRAELRDLGERHIQGIRRCSALTP